MQRKISTNDLKNEIVGNAALKGMPLKELTKRLGYSATAGFYAKLNKGTITYREVKKIASILGKKLVWEDIS
jgi:hypothetical protein